MPPTPEPSDAEPDEEIVRRVLAGDAAAASILFDRHLPALRAGVRRRLPAALRGKVGESDVIQEAVRKIYGRALARLSERLHGAGGTGA